MFNLAEKVLNLVVAEQSVEAGACYSKCFPQRWGVSKRCCEVCRGKIRRCVTCYRWSKDPLCTIGW